MKKYEFVEGPTSDVEFRAYGKSLEELIENSALALSEVMCDIKKIKTNRTTVLETNGKDEGELIYNWLSEVLAQHEIENIFFSGFKVQKLEKITEGYKVKVAAKGETVRSNLILTVVKAVTYHNFSVKKNNIWAANVVLDI